MGRAKSESGRRRYQDPVLQDLQDHIYKLRKTGRATAENEAEERRAIISAIQYTFQHPAMGAVLDFELLKGGTWESIFARDNSIRASIGVLDDWLDDLTSDDETYDGGDWSNIQKHLSLCQRKINLVLAKNKGTVPSSTLGLMEIRASIDAEQAANQNAESA